MPFWRHNSAENLLVVKYTFIQQLPSKHKLQFLYMKFLDENIPSHYKGYIRDDFLFLFFFILSNSNDMLGKKRIYK